MGRHDAMALFTEEKSQVDRVLYRMLPVGIVAQIREVSCPGPNPQNPDAVGFFFPHLENIHLVFPNCSPPG